MTNLCFLHREYTPDAPSLESLCTSSTALWKTCRRELLFLSEQEVADLSLNLNYLKKHKPHSEPYSLTESSKFLTEILCGLHSPLLGETEVFGQFKNWYQSQLDAGNSWAIQSQDWVQNIYTIVKEVRSSHLRGLGSERYGAWIRRMLSAGDTVDFIGSGQLVEESLEWLAGYPVRIWARDPAKALTKKWLADAVKNGTVELLELNQWATDSLAKDSRVTVIAAPLSLEDVKKYLRPEERVLDLRQDSVSLGENWITLADCFKDFESSKKFRNKQYQSACDEISRKVDSLSMQSHLRPFGWDDLWAHT